MSLATPTGAETPDLLDVIKGQIRTALLEVNTSMPGIIKSYDPTTRTATVQPAMKRTTVEGKVEPRPRLDEVPVVFPYSGTKGITFPLEDGDPCLLVFSQRSIDDWVTLKLEAPVTDSRLHDINDAFCIPGPASPLSVIPLEEGFQINHDKIWIGNNQSIPLVLSGLPNTELIQIVTKLLELLQTPLAVTGALANLNPVVAAQFTEMQSALGALTP